MTYKNVTPNDLNVIGYGIVKAGETFEADVEIESQNIVKVDTEEVKAKKEKVS